MIDKRYMRKRHLKCHKPRIQKYANHMWKGFSEIDIFWVNFNFRDKFLLFLYNFREPKILVKLERA